MFNLRKFDWIFFLVMLLLLSTGITMIYSITTTDTSIQKDFWSQLSFAIVGLMVYLFFANLDYRSFKGMSIFFLILAYLLLVLVLIIGTEVNSAKRWFDLYFFKFQPSELTKLFLILYLADYLDKNQLIIRSFRHIVFCFLVTLIPFLLILAEPDLGTAMVVLVLCFIILPISGIQMKYYLYSISSFIILLPFVWLFVLKDYQKDRVLAIFNPSYHVQQAIIAIGSGGLLGKGIGFGTQTQLRFLPVRHTDFIFATLGEELGFVGIAIVLILFSVLLLKILYAAYKSIDNFGALVAIGIFAMFFFQIIVNIGMNLSLLPVTGITLPLVSYGGSSLLVSLSSLGIIQSIFMRGQERKDDYEDV